MLMTDEPHSYLGESAHVTPCHSRKRVDEADDDASFNEENQN